MRSAPDPLAAGIRRPAAQPFDVARIRQDFPILEQKINGRPLVYLDSAASSQKPRAVIESIRDCYSRYYSNIHRGVHRLSEQSTTAYEAARVKVQKFLNARESREVIFVRSTTEAINLVAQTYGRKFVGSGDEVLITTMEHHSNIVPWQMLCEEKGAALKVAPINDDGELLMEEFRRLLTPRTRIVALVHLSNSLGTINPVREIVELAHDQGAVVLLDGAQAAPHLEIDVQGIGCDFYAFSGHKLYGPSGVGVLYGREKWLEEMPPYQGGGDMISTVTFEKTTYNSLPFKFEAGTPNITGGIGLGAAIDYLEGLDLAAARAHEQDLLDRVVTALSGFPGLRIIGQAQDRASNVSFVLDRIHAHDIGTILDQEGIAVRTGHHCTQPLMKRFGVPATARVSFAIFNTREEIAALVGGLQSVRKVFGE